MITVEQQRPTYLEPLEKAEAIINFLAIRKAPVTRIMRNRALKHVTGLICMIPNFQHYFD